MFPLRRLRVRGSRRSDPAQDLREQGVKHVAYDVDDVTRLVAHLPALGVDVVWEIEHAGYKVAFVLDNTGNLVEFMQPE